MTNPSAKEVVEKLATQRESKLESNEWYVSFVMPSGSTYGHLPHPNDPQVILRELGTQTRIAASFLVALPPLNYLRKK